MKYPVQYPSHNINPKSKDDNWIRHYIEAAWNESERDGHSFFSQGEHFHEIMQYARGEQDVSQYLAPLDVDTQDRDSFMKLDLRVLRIAAKFRRIALGKLNKVGYNISATPIDQLARSEHEEHFNQVRAKLLARKALRQAGPGLENHPALIKREGEPGDLEEFEMQSRFTGKHNMAIEAETALDVVLHENRYKEISKNLKQDFFDYGVGALKEYLDHNHRVALRHIHPYRLITNFCEEKDFSDLTHVGEVQDLTIGELKDITGDNFVGEQWEEIVNQCLGRYGNGRNVPQGKYGQPGENSLKVRLVHMEIMSVDDHTYRGRIDKWGNKVFRKTAYKKGPNPEKGYRQRSVSALYKGSWIVGTPYIYDTGKSVNQKRGKKNLQETNFSYHLYAPDLYDMKPLGIMEQVIPVVNQIMILWLKLQNVIAEARPKGIAIDFTAIESVSLGEGGEVMEPEDVIDMFLQKGVLVYRRYDPKSGYSAARPIEELDNGVGKDAIFFYQQILNNIQLIRDITGMNELTDGSTPDARTLTSIAAMAQEGSNNALFYVIDGERDILERASKDLLLRVQDVIKSGKGYDGYQRSLGSNSIAFWKASERLPAHIFGIQVEIKPDDASRQRLLEYATKYAGDEGLLPEDIFLIENTENIKQAQEILSFRFARRRKERQQHQLNLQRDRVNAEKDSAIQQEREKQMTRQVENELQKDLETHKKNLETDFEKLRHKHRMTELGFNAEKDQYMKGMDMARDVMGGK